MYIRCGLISLLLSFCILAVSCTGGSPSGVEASKPPLVGEKADTNRETVQTLFAELVERDAHITVEGTDADPFRKTYARIVQLGPEYTKAIIAQFPVQGRNPRFAYLLFTILGERRDKAALPFLCLCAVLDEYALDAKMAVAEIMGNAIWITDNEDTRFRANLWWSRYKDKWIKEAIAIETGGAVPATQRAESRGQPTD
jgi:hypothetical protein